MTTVERTLKELWAMPNINEQSSYFQCPTFEVDFDLTDEFIRSLPIFHGFVGDDPHKHLNEFHAVCSVMKPRDVTDDQIKFRAFLLSLADNARDWYYDLSFGSIKTWAQLEAKFIEKFFSAFRVQEESYRQAYDGLWGVPQSNYNPYSNTYNPGWNYHSNLSYAPRPPNYYEQQCPPFSQQTQSVGTSLEDMIKALIANTQQFQQENQNAIKNLENQMSHMATTMNELVSQNSGKLPSQVIVNPKENANAVTLKSGKESKEPERISRNEEENELEKEKDPITKNKPMTFVIPPPFPGRFANCKQVVDIEDESPTYEKEVGKYKTLTKYEIFGEYELLREYEMYMEDAISDDEEVEGDSREKNVDHQLTKPMETLTEQSKVIEITPPKYENEVTEYEIFGEDEISDDEKEDMEDESPTLEKELISKCKDPGKFIISCMIGDVQIENTMLDFGSSVNIMSRYIYESLNVKKLRKTDMIIQLAGGSNASSKEFLENVLVHVNNLIFPADFYVVDMDEDQSSKLAPLILGKPFLKTSRAKIDLHDGTLTMEFEDEFVMFNLYDSMKCSTNDCSMFGLDATNFMMQRICEFNDDEPLKVAWHIDGFEPPT